MHMINDDDDEGNQQTWLRAAITHDSLTSLFAFDYDQVDLFLYHVVQSGMFSLWSDSIAGFEV